MGEQKQEQPRRESYADTIQYQILGWYIGILRETSHACQLLGQLKSMRVTDYDAMAELSSTLLGIKGNIEWLARGLFIEEDKKSIPTYESFLRESMNRGPRPPTRAMMEGRARAYLNFLSAMEDEYEALSLQLDFVRDILARRKWLDLSHRPEPRPHGGVPL